MASALGVKCEACHEWAKEKDKTIVASQLNFANDSKPMEDASRLMYVMTEEINSKFVAKVEGSGMPVTCGTCHRGRVAPEPFSPHLRESTTISTRRMGTTQLRRPIALTNPGRRSHR